jgi:Protein of unknown function (DUF3617)
MKKLAVFVSLAALASPFVALADSNPFGDSFKGKMKAGQYDMSMEMDMGAVPGMPPGMGKQNFKFSHCITQEDIDKGALNKGRDGKGMPDNCKFSDFKMSGNAASYHVECTGEHPMSMDAQIAFLSDGYDMAMQMKMAMGKGGEPMQMSQKLKSRYTGSCTGAK